jgi:site-specific recombinase XerD
MKTTLTRQEKEALLAQQDPKYATELRNSIYLQLSLNHGVPCIDLSELTWSRIDLEGGSMKLDQNDGESNRTVELSEAMVSLLQQWKEKQLHEWEKRQPGRQPLADQVFTELDGTTLDETYISNMVALYAESSGIRKKIDPESLHESSVTEESPRNV